MDQGRKVVAAGGELPDLLAQAPSAPVKRVPVLLVERKLIACPVDREATTADSIGIAPRDGAEMR